MTQITVINSSDIEGFKTFLIFEKEIKTHFTAIIENKHAKLYYSGWGI